MWPFWEDANIVERDRLGVFTHYIYQHFDSTGKVQFYLSQIKIAAGKIIVPEILSE